MKKPLITLTVMLAVAAMVVVFCGPAMAKVTGRCDNCHTMHNSQGGSDLAGGPRAVLLTNSCVGCHSHASAITYPLGTSTVPVVYTTGGEPTTHLAGGNFWWVATGKGGRDAAGHNVLGISGVDAITLAGKFAPGSQYDCANSCHFSLAVAPTSANPTYNTAGGCEGCHLNVMHHANDGTGTKYVDTAAKGWYRFLSAHPGYGAGVKGIEHSGWGPSNGTVGGNNHNEYLGVPVDKRGSISLTNNTTTAFCCGCHGNFHTQNANAATDPGSQSPWIRHPSDFVIPDVGEYSDMSISYNPLSPVARSATAMTALGNNPSGSVAAGADMVMCLSCHRPHGSPYDDLLRWGYDGMVAGAGSKTTGCFYCHTEKDTGG